MKVYLPAFLLFVAALAMALAGWRMIADGRERDREAHSSEVIIQALQMDIEDRNQRLSAQQRLLRAAQDWMAARKALPPPASEAP